MDKRKWDVGQEGTGCQNQNWQEGEGMKGHQIQQRKKKRKFGNNREQKNYSILSIVLKVYNGNNPKFELVT